jgi:hypothetical protein
MPFGDRMRGHVFLKPEKLIPLDCSSARKFEALGLTASAKIASHSMRGHTARAGTELPISTRRTRQRLMTVSADHVKSVTPTRAESRPSANKHAIESSEIEPAILQSETHDQRGGAQLWHTSWKTDLLHSQKYVMSCGRGNRRGQLQQSDPTPGSNQWGLGGWWQSVCSSDVAAPARGH